MSERHRTQDLHGCDWLGRPQQCQQVQVRGAHGRFEVLAMDDDTDSVVSAVSFEEGFERDLGPPTAATLVDEVEPTQRANGADFSPVSRGSGLV